MSETTHVQYDESDVSFAVLDELEARAAQEHSVRVKSETLFFMASITRTWLIRKTHPPCEERSPRWRSVAFLLGLLTGAVLCRILCFLIWG